MFEANPERDRWTIKNQKHGHFIGVEDFTPIAGSRVVSVKEQYVWCIEEDDGHFKYVDVPTPSCCKIFTSLPRISVPDTPLYMDISNHGDGPNIEIQEEANDSNQSWIFEQGKLDIFRIYLQQHKW